MFIHKPLITVNMKLYCVLVSFLLTTKSTFGVNILQHPPNLLSKEGESGTLECAHDDAEFYRMFWYKQNTNGNMELVAYSMGTSVADVEPIFDKANYIMIRDEQLKSSLQIRNVKSGDSAVYYCAASSAH
uniref:Ig-like domain-containing protein n=1 Tax=Oncorhynchus tshawytscha TaxID=74940 RepID=A0AAZ3S536_ONCTS